MKYDCDLLSKAVNFCKQNKWIKKNDIVLLALSGGADSVFLFHVLVELKKILQFDLHAVHINHLLRGKESDGDELFVAELTKKFKVKFFSYKVNISEIAGSTGKSIEMAARDVRYEFIYKTADEIGACVIATAHNADDRVETALMRFITGSSVSGISGLRAVREHKNIKIVRPIINFFKADILDYLEKNNISFRFDSSNTNDIYQRNKIRNRLIPFLEKEFNPNLKNNLLTTVSLFEAQADYFKGISVKLFREILLTQNKFLVLDKTKLMDLHPCIINQIVIDSLYTACENDIRIASYHLKNLVGQIQSNASHTYDFPDNIVAVTDRHYLIIMNRLLYGELIRQQEIEKRVQLDSAFSFELSCGLLIDVCVSGIQKKEEIKNEINKNFRDDLITGKEVLFSISLPYDNSLLMRFRRQGDRICFKYGTKTLKKFFVDSHTPFILRNLLPVISNHDRILWSPGMSLNDLPENQKNEKWVTIQIKMKFN